MIFNWYQYFYENMIHIFKLFSKHCLCIEYIRQGTLWVNNVHLLYITSISFPKINEQVKIFLHFCLLSEFSYKIHNFFILFDIERNMSEWIIWEMIFAEFDACFVLLRPHLALLSVKKIKFILTIVHWESAFLHFTNEIKTCGIVVLISVGLGLLKSETNECVTWNSERKSPNLIENKVLYIF